MQRHIVLTALMMTLGSLTLPMYKPLSGHFSLEFAVRLLKRWDTGACVTRLIRLADRLRLRSPVPGEAGVVLCSELHSESIQVLRNSIC